MRLGQGSTIVSFPEGSQLGRLTAHLLGTALPPLQSLTRGDLFWARYSTPKDSSCIAILVEFPRSSSYRIY